MSRPTTHRAAAQSRANTDPDLPIPDSPGTDASVNAVGGLTDEPDGADPRADMPNVSARELMELLGRVLADHAPAAPPAPSSASRSIKVNPPEEFDGRSSQKLKSFLISCNNTFCGDPDVFANDDKWVAAVEYTR